LSAAELKAQLVRYAQSLGFERVGITSAQPLQPEEDHLKHWIAGGRAGEMDYMSRAPERRARPAELLAGAKSVIALAMTYAAEGALGGGGDGEKDDLSAPTAPSSPVLSSVLEGRIARYTAGSDYHKTIGKRLSSFVRYLEAFSPGAECRTFVDTGPLLERAIAQRAGLGFIGKNTMLITKGLGSWVFLASVITTAELPVDSPDERSCGECRLCIDACPTQAITAAFELDARRCIAYLTIEKDGPIPEDLRGKTGPWVFGCDICQEVCPHNARSTGAPMELGLAQILSIGTEEEFQKQFSGTALTRAGRDGLLRNACVAAANLGRADLVPVLKALTVSSSPLLREHASWAIRKIEVISSRTNASEPSPGSAGPRVAAADLR